MSVDFEDPEDIERILRKTTAFGKIGTTRLILQEIGRDIALHYNGENALKYFFEHIRPHDAS